MHKSIKKKKVQIEEGNNRYIAVYVHRNRLVTHENMIIYYDIIMLFVAFGGYSTNFGLKLERKRTSCGLHFFSFRHIHPVIPTIHLGGLVLGPSLGDDDKIRFESWITRYYYV